jgi:hypothetical protein
MATTVTTANHQDCISGSPEKRMATAPDGTIWLAVIDTNRLTFFSSADNSSTYTYSGTSDLALGSGEDTAVPSFVIDADGYAHVAFVRWQTDPQTIRYARGTPRTGGGWSWSTLTVSPAGGRLSVDSDLVVFRNGTGWVAWISYCYTSGVLGAKLAKVDISASGALSVGTLTHGPSVNAAAYQLSSVTFAHTGDGKTASASPHVFFAVASEGSSSNAWLYRAKYQAGTWTWETPVTFDTGIDIDDGALCSIHDGSRVFVVWARSASQSVLRAAEWDGVAGAVTARTPPALPGGTGNINGIALALDQSTQDIHVVVYGDGTYDVMYCVFSRATNTWGAWSTAAARTIDDSDGHVQLVRYPQNDSIDMAFTEGTGPYTVKAQQLVALARTPSAPTLISPASGARVDLASGATFTWAYSSVSPGDTQQGFVFKRTYSSTTEYWNVPTQAWQAGPVVNASNVDTPHQVSFPSGKWSTGTTYTWYVSTRSSTGSDSAFSAGRTVIASLAPTVAVTAPSGIYYGESTPLVQWTYTSATTQRDYRVRIVATEGITIDPNDPLPAVWDSGVVTSAIARSARVTVSLSDGIAYRAYVQCTDVSGVASPWVSSDFSLSLQPPSGPVVEATDTVKYETGVVRVSLTAVARSNFLSSPAGRGQADWTAVSNCSIAAQPDDPANLLVASLYMVSLVAGNLVARTSVGSPPPAPVGRPQPLGPLSFPVVAGATYTAIAAFKAAGAARAAHVVIEWYDADDGTGSLISSSSGGQVVTGAVAYTPAYVTDAAPAGAVLARMVIEVIGAVGAGEVFYAGNLSLHPGGSTTWQAGGYSSTQTIAVERSTDGGSTWSTIVERVKPDLYQRATVDDRTLPLGVDVKYRAVTNVDIGSGSVLTSAQSPVTTVSIEAPFWVIRDSVEDDKEFDAVVTEFNASDDDASAVYYVPGRQYPIVDTDGSRAPSGTFTVYARGGEVDYITSVLRTTNPVLLQSPAGRVYMVRITKRDYMPVNRTARSITCTYYEVD